MKNLFFLICFFALTFASNAQQIKNSYIIDLKKGKSATFLMDKNISRYATQANSKVLSATLDIVCVNVDKEGDANFESWLDGHRDIESWSYNHYVQKREIPDDEYFDLQWGLDMINVRDAWEITTGGFDANNREIVIAVLDESFDLEHPELEGRLFFNEAEIPDDGIDNDENGYIDDYSGWNTTLGTDKHPLTDNHGTAVSGIIGANTNNELGIAGINWQIKILPISGIATQAEVIGGYEYVTTLRRRFNETDGAEGAYIVATNYSAGIDEVFGTDPQFKSWCDMYEVMADQGILSTGATANRNVDVDALGDMPTTCPSPFLISVTNIDINEAKVSKAGFGLVNIDLGAPGKGTLALDINAGYDQNFGGTSAATPHVAGTIGLLYSVPCTAIAELATTNPRQAAEIIRNAIFSGTTSNSTLEGITVTGGRLDVYGAIEALQSVCGDIELISPKGDLSIRNLEIEQDGRLFVEYVTEDESEYNIMVSDVLGRVIRRQLFVPPSIGRKELRLEIPQLVSGIYFISIYNQDNISTSKIFIQ